MKYSIHPLSMSSVIVTLLLCMSAMTLVDAFHGAVGANDAYPLPESTPAAIVAAEILAGRAVPLTYAGNVGAGIAAANCATLATAFHGLYVANPALNGRTRMLGAMVIDTAAGRVINFAASGWSNGPTLGHLGGHAAALGGAFVEATPAQKNGLCYWARSVWSRPALFTANPPMCSAQVREPTPAFEYTWTAGVGADTINKVQYKHDANSLAYTFNSEINNAMGQCAGTKLALTKPAGTVRCMAEVLANHAGGAPVVIEHFHTNPAGGAGAMSYANGELVPSCSTCQGVIPKILDGTVGGWLVGHPLGANQCMSTTNNADWTALINALPPVVPAITDAAKRLQVQTAFAQTHRVRATAAAFGAVCNVPRPRANSRFRQILQP